MAYSVLINHRVRKYVRKLKDRNLKIAITNAIYDEIAAHPYKVGDAKIGDLNNFFTYKLHFKGIQYRIAYEVNETGNVVIIALTGTRGNFYNELKRIINS